MPDGIAKISLYGVAVNFLDLDILMDVFSSENPPPYWM